MTTINSKEFLDSYHRGQLPFSFGGKHHVKDYVDISNADWTRTSQKVMFILNSGNLESLNLHLR